MAAEEALLGALSPFDDRRVDNSVGQLPQLDVHSLRRPAQDVEGLLLGDALAGHDDALRHADEVPAAGFALELLLSPGGCEGHGGMGRED